MAELTDSQLQRYARQLIVPQIDLEGQQRLKAARVLIVGAGGLGVPMAQYLAGAGVGFIRIADDDQIELSNLPRQVAYTEADVGRAKVDVLSARLKAGNTEITVDACAERFDASSAFQLLDTVSLVLDATDSLQARQDIDRITRQQGLPWIMGSAVRTSGQWAAFDPQRRLGCYHCLMSDPIGAENRSCAELGILGPVVGLVSLQQALWAIKFLIDGSLPWAQLHIMDAWSGEQTQLALSVRPDCPLCHSAES